MDTVEELSIIVSPDTAKLIREKVDDGSFASPAEVVDAAVKALVRDEDDHAGRIASIRARIKASIDDPRPPVPLEEAFDRVLNGLNGH